MKNQDLTTVTYNFADNTKVVSQITKFVLTDERGRKRTINDLHKIFQTTASDKGAISYTLDGIEDKTDNLVKEQYFTAKQRYNAKKDYREFKRNNPEVFFKENNQLIRYITDKVLARRLRFNLTSLTQFK